MSDILSMKKKLARILLDKSYMEGDFTLTSGRKSDYYFDCRQSSLNPEGAYLIGSIFFEMLKDMDVHAVAGMTMGADPLVTSTSLVAFQNQRNLPALIVRKEAKKHGAGRAIEGLANVEKGAPVILLEDVVSTGGSVLKACEHVKDAGLSVLGIFCILNREEGGDDAIKNAGYPLHTIFTRRELLEAGRS